MSGNFNMWNSYNAKAARTELTNPPMNPIHVFLGDTVGKSFLGKNFPREIPKAKAPTSEHHIIIKKHRRRLPLKFPALSNAIKLESAIGTAMYNNPV